MSAIDTVARLCTLPSGTKIIRNADHLDLQVDAKRVLLVEKPDGSVFWILFDGAEQPFIRDN